MIKLLTDFRFKMEFDFIDVEILVASCTVTFAVGIISAIFFYLVYSGMFARIDVTMEKKHLLNTPRVVAYKVYTGSYMERFGNFSRLRKVAPYSDTIGIYYDNPQNVRICYQFNIDINPPPPVITWLTCFESHPRTQGMGFALLLPPPHEI